MDFNWSDEQIAYRARVREAVEELIPDDWFERFAPQGFGSAEQIEFSRRFCPAFAKRGLLTPHWPKEWGGGGGDAWEHFILSEEMKNYGEPRGPQYMNVNWIGPTLMKYGSPEQQAEYLPRIARGEIVWCQGYSEPGAGTDLAALQTRAERVDDHYVINGSKIWTSYSRKADVCFLLARTGAERKAISVFLVPMDTPGIEVVPFAGLVNDGHLNEVFFTDVRVPVGARVAEEGRAWDVVTYALGFERVGIPRYQIRYVLDLAIAQLKTEGRFQNNPIIRSRAAKIFAKAEATRLLTYVVVDQRAKQRPASTDSNIVRLSAVDMLMEVMSFLMDYVPDCLTDGHPLLKEFYRSHVSMPIVAGTYELQLNIVAERELGLPRGS